MKSVTYKHASTSCGGGEAYVIYCTQVLKMLSEQKYTTLFYKKPNSTTLLDTTTKPIVCLCVIRLKFNGRLKL